MVLKRAVSWWTRVLSFLGSNEKLICDLDCLLLDWSKFPEVRRLFIRVANGANGLLLGELHRPFDDATVLSQPQVLAQTGPCHVMASSFPVDQQSP